MINWNVTKEENDVIHKIAGRAKVMIMENDSELSGRRRRDRRKAAVSMRLRNLTNQFGSWHPDPFHFEWRPVYMRKCPALVKEENERVNVEILVNFLTIQIGGMLVISIFALAI